MKNSNTKIIFMVEICSVWDCFQYCWLCQDLLGNYQKFVMGTPNESDFELPNKMASLDLWDASQTNRAEFQHNAVSLRRSSRKKTQSPKKLDPVANRRVTLKPKKIQPMVLSEDKIKKLYSNSTFKTVSQKLETIFEEPKAVNNTLSLISGRKIKRSLKFQETSVYTKEKIKKRRSNIKRFLGNRNFANRKPISMDKFLQTLKNLEADTGPDNVDS